MEKWTAITVLLDKGIVLALCFCPVIPMVLVIECVNRFITKAIMLFWKIGMVEWLSMTPV